MNARDDLKKGNKFFVNGLRNLNDYPQHETIIECSACKNVSINPFFCKNCNVSFCKYCISELKISTCPYCKANELQDETANFNQFFKDLYARCSDCNEFLEYPKISNHFCSRDLKTDSILISNSNNIQDQDEIKYKDGLIHILCKICLEYIPNPVFDNHPCINPNLIRNNINNNNPTLQRTDTNINNSTNNMNKDPQINNLCNDLLNQKLACGINEESLLSKKYSEINLENKINKLENVLANFISNFTNTFKTKPRMLDISNAINNLNSSIIELNKMNQFSFCNTCFTPKKISDLCPCSCKFCENDKKYCLDCIKVCKNCHNLMNKNCQFICSICKGAKCSSCEEQKELICLCLDNRVCSSCHKFNMSNNPNLSIQNYFYLRENHNNCRFVKSLFKNIFIVKYFNGDLKFNITLNNNKQLITVFFIKNKIDLLSKIIQIGLNDTIKFTKDNTKLSLKTNEDSWEINLLYLDKKIDYIVFNFNIDQEKLNLNIFENLDFNSLPNSNHNFTNVLIHNLQGQMLQEKHLIKSIYFEKL